MIQTPDGDAKLDYLTDSPLRQGLSWPSLNGLNMGLAAFVQLFPSQHEWSFSFYADAGAC
jgi:hypothetical protein